MSFIDTLRAAAITVRNEKKKEANSATRIGDLFLAIIDYLSRLILGIIYQEPVNAEPELKTKYPDGTAKTGWTALVKTGVVGYPNGAYFQYNESTKKWTNTGMAGMPSDVVTIGNLPKYEQMEDVTVGAASLNNTTGTPSTPASTRLTLVIPNMAIPIVRITGTTTNSAVRHIAYIVLTKLDKTEINLTSQDIIFENDKFDLTLSYLSGINYEYSKLSVLIQAINITAPVKTTLTNIYLPTGIKNNLKINDITDYLPIIPGFFSQSHVFTANTSPNTNVCVNRHPVKAGETFIFSGHAYWNAVFVVKEDGSFVDILGATKLGSQEIVIPVDGYLCCWSISYLRIAKISLSTNTNQGYAINPRLSLLEKGADNLNKTLEIPLRGYSAMTPIKVKKDGTGDFKTIQEAINSINDATAAKQYDIQVYDDHIITDLKDLWLVDTPTIKNTLDNPTSAVALFITKDWISVRGMKGGGNRLYIESPANLASASFQRVQTIYPMGNSGIDNFYVGIKGGRYAIHQESSGSTTHLDYHAHTLYQNLIIEHKGNQDYVNGDGWPSVMAQANGTTSGTKMTYINCKWISPHAMPFYTHTNADFDEPNEMTMINCSMISTSKGVTVESLGAYWGDIGSGQKSTIKFIGCNIPRFKCMGGGSSRGLEQKMTTANLWNNGGSTLLGYGNAPMAVNSWVPAVLLFETINKNVNIEVVGGTARNLIFGDVYKSYLGTIDAKGLVLGSIRIENPQTWAATNPSQIFGLPYRLGNCATNPKTLIIKVNGVEYTITFNKNYMTANGSAYSWNTTPAISNSAIINDINAAFPTIFKSYMGAYTEMGTFEDCQEIGLNIDTSTLLNGMAVVRDYTGIQAWKRAKEGDIAQGIVGERINVQSGNILNSGRIILANKALFIGSLLGAANIVGGKLYKVNSSGYLSETTDREEASFIAVDNAYLKFFNEKRIG